MELSYGWTSFPAQGLPGPRDPRDLKGLRVLPDPRGQLGHRELLVPPAPRVQRAKTLIQHNSIRNHR